MNIVLIGMRGSGKTTVGKILAEKLGRGFVEMDELVVRRAGMSIPEIVKKQGWPGFRDIESAVCREVAALDNIVNATGGGVITREENIAALRKNGKLIWLQISLEKILERIGEDPSRPSLTGRSTRDDMAAVLAERTPIYRRAADHAVLTDNKTAEEVAAEILKLLEEFAHDKS